ncbi:MAG: Ig-like domain-containing protein [Deltaproteobacteria bacterium]|nr:Ig-like domain-containing protein [Deltaproteobacteria bacterium]
MKRASLLLVILMFLAGGSVLADPGGLWKSENGPTPYSWYIQTYAGGSMLVMLSADFGSFWGFLDTRFEGRFEADRDVAGNPHTLKIYFEGDDKAYAVLTFEGEKPAIFTLVRNAAAPALEDDSGGDNPDGEDPGDEDPGDEDPGDEDPGDDGTNGNPATGSILAPPDGSTVIGLTTVSGRTSHDVVLQRVTLRIGDGPEVDTMFNVLTGSFLYMWESTTSPKGPVTITATCYDTAGLKKVIDTITVTVNNTVGPMANQVQPISPSNGASGLSLPIQMTWNPVDDVVGYRIQVANNSAFVSPLLVDQDVSGTSLSFNRSSSSTLYWRVRGNYSSTHFAPWSYTWSFSIAGGGQ